MLMGDFAFYQKAAVLNSEWNQATKSAGVITGMVCLLARD